MNLNKFWLLYNICAVVFMLTTAALVAKSDIIVRIDGLCAIVLAINAILQWYWIDEEKRHAND